MKKVETKKRSICLILNNIRSCFNVGSIFRTSDATGVDKIYLCGYTPTPDKEPKISKTALGAEQSVLWEKANQTWRIIKKLKSEGFLIIALEQTKKSKNIFEYKIPQNTPIALIAGHERNGLSKEIINHTDGVVEIPMLGKKESLNVSVAVGVALYHLIK